MKRYSRVEFSGRTLPLRLRNLAEREATHQRFTAGHPMTIRAMRCSRGCAHGRAFMWRGHIRLYLSTTLPDGALALGIRGIQRTGAHFDNDQNRYLLIHELAHLASSQGGHNDHFYREAIRIARREGCLRGWLEWQGRSAKAAARRLRKAA